MQQTLSQVGSKLEIQQQTLQERQKLAGELDELLSDVKNKLREAVNNPAWDAELRRIVVATISNLNDTIYRDDLQAD